MHPSDQEPLPPVPTFEPTPLPPPPPPEEWDESAVAKMLASTNAKPTPALVVRAPGVVGCAVVGAVVMPIVCLLADPIVFEGSSFVPNRVGGVLHEIRGGARVFIVQAILAMIAVLLAEKKLGRIGGWFAVGYFAMAAFLALAIGVVLLPFSFFGLFFLVGVLGFTPFVTAYAFGRVGWDIAHHFSPPPKLAPLVMLIGACVAVAPAIVVEMSIDRTTATAIAAIEAGDEAKASRALDTLATFAPLADPVPFAEKFFHYDGMNDRLADKFAAAHEKISGTKPISITEARD